MLKDLMEIIASIAAAFGAFFTARSARLSKKALKS